MSKSVFRPEMLALEQNGITRLAFPRMEDPSVNALWFGEGDIFLGNESASYNRFGNCVWFS